MPGVGKLFLLWVPPMGRVKVCSFAKPWLPAVEAFLAEHLPQCGTPNLSSRWLHDFLRGPGEVVAERLLLGSVVTELQACCVLHHESRLSRCIAELVVARGENSQSVIHELIVRVCLLARSAGLATLHVPAIGDSHLANGLAAANFQPVRCYKSYELAAVNSAPGELAPGEVSLRRYAGPADASEIAALQNACFHDAFGYEPNNAGEISQYVEQRGGPQNLIIASDPDAKALAYIWISLHGDPQDRAGEHSGRIEMLGVHPQVRRHGIAKQLLRTGVTELFARGATRVVLDVDADNQAAVALYVGMGFTECFSYFWFEKATA